MNIKRTLPFFLVSALLTLSVLSIAVIPVHAYTNSFTGIGNTSCTNPCTNPVTVTGTVATANDILVVVIQCETQYSVFSITDTNVIGWARANEKTIPTQTGAGNPDGATSHANSVNAMGAIWSSGLEPSGAITVTITFTASNLYCVETLLEANTPSVAVNTGAFSIQQFSEPSTSANSVLSQVSIHYPTVPPNSLVLFFAGAIGVNANHNMNGVTVNAPASTISGSSSATGGTFVSASQSIDNSATYNHFCCSGVGNYDTDWFMSVVFSQQGVLPSKQPAAYTLGCTVAAASTAVTKLTGNTTVYYPVWGKTGDPPSIMANVTVDVASVALTNGQVSAFLQVGEYFSTTPTPQGQGPSQPNGNWLLAGNQAIVLTNTGVAKNYTFNIQGSGPSSTGGAAIGVWVSHNGISLRQAKAVSQNMYYDNGTLAYKSLTQFNPATKNACFGTKITFGQAVQSFTFSSFTTQTTTTTLQTITVISGTATVTVKTAPIVESDIALFNFIVGLALIAGIGIVFAILAAKHSQSGSGALVGMIFGALIGTILYVLFVDPTKAWVLAIVVVGMILTMVLGNKSGAM